MNHCVPDFEMNEEYSIPLSSGLSRQKKPALMEDDIMELLWQNGQVVMQSQNQRSVKKSAQSAKFLMIDDALIPAEKSAAREIRSAEEEVPANLFMQEDEMASWLHYPLEENFDRDFCSDLLYPAPCTTDVNPVRTYQTPEIHTPAPVAPRPPIPPSRRIEAEPTSKVHNFVHFSRTRQRGNESGPSVSNNAARELTVVDSSETPGIRLESRVSQGQFSGGNVGLFGTTNCGAATPATSYGGSGRELVNCELTVTSSPGGSGSASGSGASMSASVEPLQKPAADDRKRKGIEISGDGEEDDNTDFHKEDTEFQSVDAKKQARGSTSAKRSRAAEVHNLSERRRRDRINEKMKALQELIPRCNKSDKASMLDEAIEYLKSLQLQVQMMSMGYGMVPMMFPGVQQYMPPTGMGMGMRMGMEMGMSRPMMPYHPAILAGSTMPTPATATHLGPRYPLPPFHMTPLPTPDSARMPAPDHSTAMLNSYAIQNPNNRQLPSFIDPYQQYLSLHHMQIPVPQNQAIMQQPSSSKPSSSRGSESFENHQSG